MIDKIKQLFTGYFGESMQGLLWAILVLLLLFVHYTVTIEVPEFRYVDF